MENKNNISEQELYLEGIKIGRSKKIIVDNISEGEEDKLTLYYYLEQRDLGEKYQFGYTE